MQIKEKCAQLQAVVFASGEPVELSRLAQAIGVSPEETASLIGEVNILYREQEIPFEIVILSGAAQICTRAEYADVIREALALRRNIPLSQAAFEVLAIIAYNQPVTKAFVEQVRGVDSSGVIGSLVEKALIEEAGRLELPGRPIAYRTSRNFLRCFSLESLEDLPEIEEDTPDTLEDEPTEELEGQLGFSDTAVE